MTDTFRETTSVGWFGRIKRSVGGFIVGLILVAAMVVLLFWNEGRAVTTARSLTEGASSVVSVDAGTVDPANDGRLVHVTGRVATDATPSDPDFAVSAQGIRLERSVEMYQWRQSSQSETVKKLGGGEETVTTYTYTRDWESSPVDSRNFKNSGGHSNPPMNIRNRSFQVPSAKLGAFDLDEPVLSKMSGEEFLSLSPDQRDTIDSAYSGSKEVNIIDGQIFLGSNSTFPAIGDYRIGYQLVPLGDASIVGRQDGSHFTAYQTVAGDALLMVVRGAVAADRMFADAVSANTLITWIVRVAGFLILFLGFTLLLGPIGVVADFVPIFGSIVRFGAGVIAFLLAILVGAAVVAIAWFWYRPLLSFAVIAVGVALPVVIILLRRRRRRDFSATPAAPTPQMPAEVSPPSVTPPPGPAGPVAGKPGKIAW